MAGQVMYTPKAENNPWRVEDRKTPEEWLMFALWYPYSVRSLNYDGCWYEAARCSNHDSANHVLKGLSLSHHSSLGCYVVVQYFRLGKEGREKAVLFFPSERRIKAVLAEAKEGIR